MWKRLYLWFDDRLRLKPIQDSLLDEPIPGGASWIYVFGSITLFLFLIQLISGMFLAVYYVASPDHAYDTIQYIMNSVLFGSFIRGLHHWGASGMIIAIGLHMLQVYLYGAYKPPRELMWMMGVALFILTLSFSFSGYLLPWDQKAYWATQVGINMVGTIPFVGDSLIRVIRGGESLGAITLSRFFALHILFLPLATMGLIALHLFVLRRVGPAGPFDEARAKKSSEPFYPRQVFMDAVIMLVVFMIVAGMALLVPFPLADKADPSDTSFTPVPEWYFLFYYQGLKYFQGPFAPLATWILPMIFYLGLFFLPFIDPTPSRNPVKRPTAISVGILFLLVVFGLMAVSIKEISSIPRTDLSVASGKELYLELGCGVCHRIHGEGGSLGPDLSYVGKTRSQDWLMRHFKDPQAMVPGSIMPSYPLHQDELEDLTDYMLSLK